MEFQWIYLRCNKLTWEKQRNAMSKKMQYLLLKNSNWFYSYAKSKTSSPKMRNIGSIYKVNRAFIAYEINVLFYEVSCIVWSCVPFLRVLSQRLRAIPKYLGFQKWPRLVKMMKIIRQFARVFRDKMRFHTRVFKLKSGKITRVLGAKYDMPRIGTKCPG